MRRYIAFIHSLKDVLEKINNTLQNNGSKPNDEDDYFHEVHLYIWYVLNRIFDPTFGSKESELDILSLMVGDVSKVQQYDQAFRKAILQQLGRITPALVSNPKEFMHQYVTNGRDYSEVLVFVPTYVFKEIPASMEPLTQVAVSQMIDRYVSHFETTEAGKIMGERINQITELEIPKDKLVPKRFWANHG